MNVRVTLTGRRYDLAEHLPPTLELADDATLASALARLTSALPGDDQLPATCMIAVGGTHLGTLAAHRDCPLQDGDEIVLVTPVAGG